MATRDAVPALLCILLCVLSVATPAAAAPDGSAAGPGLDPLVQQGVQPDSTRIVVDVDADGSAHWEIEYWTRLDDENTTEAFQSLQDDVRANPDDYTSAFASRINDTVSAAENATGREMAATNVSVATETRSLPDSYGVVTYSFEWSNFAAVDGDRLVVGDAIEGFFLDSNSRLIVSWPDDYGSVSVEPAGDEMRDNTVVWRGSDTEFVSGEPRVVLEAGAGGGGTATATGTDDTGTTPATVDDPFPTTSALAVLAVVALLLVGGVFYLRSRGVVGDDDEFEARGGSPAGGTDAEAEPDDAGHAHATAAAGADEPAPAAEAGDEADAEAEAEDVPPELLSNEERVLRLIESRGGRIKQQEVAGALDWTDAKTSKVVRGMRDEGTIEGFRLGRENVLRLPEDDDEQEDV